jgi:hypothetical protein
MPEWKPGRTMTFTVVEPVHDTAGHLERCIAALLVPFADPAIDVVAGHTHIQTDSVYSKAVALWWFFPLRAAHPVPRGWRHFMLRALAQGRDRVPRERGWRAAVAGSAARLVHHIADGFVRTLRDRRHVALPLADVPAAMALCCAYYSLYCAGELAALSGVNAVRRIRI